MASNAGDIGNADGLTRSRGRGGVMELMAQELRRTWRSYAATAVGNLFFGMFAASLFWTIVRPSDGVYLERWSFQTDLVFVLLVSLLSLNWISRNYVAVWEDPFSRWLGFLRALPVPVRDIVAARARVMVGATVVMSGVFFVPFYALNSWVDPLMTEVVPPLDYLWFAGIWVGYALLLGGLGLYLELGVRGKTVFLAQGAVAITTLLILLVLDGTDTHLVAGSFEMAQRYGPLPAAVALAAGIAGILISCRATTRRLRRRSFPA